MRPSRFRLRLGRWGPLFIDRRSCGHPILGDVIPGVPLTLHLVLGVKPKFALAFPKDSIGLLGRIMGPFALIVLGVIGR
jgi:hypothetical protein